jgi:hypothetical protein
VTWLVLGSALGGLYFEAGEPDENARFWSTVCLVVMLTSLVLAVAESSL